jgi:cell wall assembly regulator SMI1
VNQRTDKRQDQGPAQAKDVPARERRASYRVNDDQNSGEGSLTALSKLKMIERKLAAWRAMRKES